MLESEDKELPLQITDFRVLETERPQSFPENLWHLPPATNISLVEIDMKSLVHESTLKSFSQLLQRRDKIRKQKAAKEERYVEKADKYADRKFEKLKKQCSGIDGPTRLTNDFYIPPKQQQEEHKEEESKDAAIPESKESSVWDQFGKTPVRPDLALFALENPKNT